MRQICWRLTNKRHRRSSGSSIGFNYLVSLIGVSDMNRITRLQSMLIVGYYMPGLDEIS